MRTGRLWETTSIFNTCVNSLRLEDVSIPRFLGGGGVPKLGHESRQSHPLGCAPIPAYINNSICEANEISAHRLLGGKINYWSDLDQFLAPATQLLGYKQGVIGWWGCWQWDNELDNYCWVTFVQFHLTPRQALQRRFGGTIASVTTMIVHTTQIVATSAKWR